MEAELVSTTDMRYLAPQLGLFAERHNPEADVQKIDKEIADKFKSNFKGGCRRRLNGGKGDGVIED